MNYLDIINRMAVLGDALQLQLPAKTKAETLLLRAHYAKGIKEWQAAMEQINNDTKPADGKERSEEEQKSYDEAFNTKAKEDAALVDRRYTTEAFEGLCSAIGDKEEIISALARNDKGEMQPIPAISWLEIVANTLVQE